jgi:uncharacterized integral membrane protein
MRIALVLLLLLTAVILAVQNAAVVTIKFLFWRGEVSLAVILALCIAIGAIGGVLAAMPRIYRMRLHERKLRAQLASLDAGQGNASVTGQKDAGEPLTHL